MRIIRYDSLTWTIWGCCCTLLRWWCPRLPGTLLQQPTSTTCHIWRIFHLLFLKQFPFFLLCTIFLQYWCWLTIHCIILVNLSQSLPLKGMAISIFRIQVQEKAIFIYFISSLQLGAIYRWIHVNGQAFDFSSFHKLINAEFLKRSCRHDITDKEQPLTKCKTV